jgi:hypothetical protein
MEWIVKIETEEEEKRQRIRFLFSPTRESLHIFGEVKLKNKWVLFSEDIHNMVITLEQLQEKMELIVVQMKKRLKEYENIDKGFSILKEVAFKDTED